MTKRELPYHTGSSSFNPYGPPFNFSKYLMQISSDTILSNLNVYTVFWHSFVGFLLFQTAAFSKGRLL